MTVETSKLKVRCPHCRNWTKWGDNPFKPFCSDQCRSADLGNWATERYRIPDPEGSAVVETEEPKSPKTGEE
jgi:endogenous inhibitor of DNA gyrase (YacG/DUF329 family)